MQSSSEPLGKVRSASLTDVGALLRLFAAAGHAVSSCACGDVSRCLEDGHVIVLELHRSVLGAAAHVAVPAMGTRGLTRRVPFFVVDPAIAQTRAERQASSSLLAAAIAAPAP